MNLWYNLQQPIKNLRQNKDALQWNLYLYFYIMNFSSLRKQPTFRDVTTGFPAKWSTKISDGYSKFPGSRQETKKWFSSSFTISNLLKVSSFIVLQKSKTVKFGLDVCTNSKTTLPRSSGAALARLFILYRFMPYLDAIPLQSPKPSFWPPSSDATQSMVE